MKKVKVISVRKHIYEELTDLKRRNSDSRGGYDSYSDVVERLVKSYKKNVKPREVLTI